MKHLTMTLALLVALTGCEAARVVAPSTVAGWEAGGLPGALDGAAGAVLARCRTLDGSQVWVAIDDAAGLTGTGRTVERIRAARRAACAAAGAVSLIVDGAAVAPAPAPRPVASD